MSIIATGGVNVISGEVTLAIVNPARYWRLETQGTGSSVAGNSISELKMTFAGTSNLLDSFTLTSIGGAFTFPLSNINDTVAETSNTVSTGFVPVANGDMDFYVDFGENNRKSVTVYSIAPQGNVGVSVFNTPVGFNAYRSSDAVIWTLVTSFTSITTGIANWTPGIFRDFNLTT